MAKRIKYPSQHGSSCPVCFRPYIKTSKDDQARSRDHIYPRCYGSPAQGVKNLRYMCVRCNCLRGTVGHCVGALACVLDVSKQTNMKATTIIKRWKFHEGWTPALKPFKQMKKINFEIELERQLNGLAI